MMEFLLRDSTWCRKKFGRRQLHEIGSGIELEEVQNGETGAVMGFVRVHTEEGGFTFERIERKSSPSRPSCKMVKRSLNGSRKIQLGRRSPMARSSTYRIR